MNNKKVKNVYVMIADRHRLKIIKYKVITYINTYV